MIAYGHCIQFIPQTDNGETYAIDCKKTVTVKAGGAKQWQDRLEFKWPLTSNQGREIALYTDRAFSRTVQGRAWAFEVKEVVTFFWNSGDLTLYYSAQEKFTRPLLEYWTLHIVLPIFFTIDETYDFLHAGAVEIDARAVLFVANSYGGKSTMTDFFIAQGHPMISDDKVAIFETDGEFMAVPSHPHHRPFRKMETLGIFVDNVSDGPKPIQALYELSRSDADAKIRITELHGMEKFKSLRFSSEMNFSFLKTERFGVLGRLAGRVPVYRISVPWDMNRLEEVYDAIIEHTRQQGAHGMLN